MEKSTHKVEVVPIYLEPHPNADSLSVVKVFGYTVCVATKDWQGKDKGAYVVPDSLVPNSGPFAWLFKPEDLLDAKYRVRVKKLRGVLSMGLLVPVPEGSNIGDDVAQILGVTRYESPEPMSTGGDNEKGPELYAPIYDVDSVYRYSDLFVQGEPVHISEKIHGCNGRFTYKDGKFYCGSRNEWKKETESNVWWKALHGNAQLKAFLMNNPEVIVYGEVYGSVQSLKYGHTQGKVSMAAFDILQGSKWLDAQEARDFAPNIPWVPIIKTNYPFDFEELKKLADGQSLIENANHMREGIVIKPMKERTCLEIGRVQLKLVSNVFLEKDK